MVRLVPYTSWIVLLCICFFTECERKIHYGVKTTSSGVSCRLFPFWSTVLGLTASFCSCVCVCVYSSGVHITWIRLIQ